MSINNSNWRFSLTATLFLLSPFNLLASLGMDMYLPVVPFMAPILRTSNETIQLTLTVYLVLLGAGQLIFGPLSDRFGRRPILLMGGLVFVCASAALSIVSSASWFLGWRILQAAAASACLVAIFATVRDIYAHRHESHVIYGLLGATLAMVPAAGPLLGALVDLWLGWRAIFALLSAGMAVAIAISWFLWPETRQMTEHQPGWRHVMLPFRSRRFWLYTLGYSAGMGSFFVFFSVAPAIMMQRQGLTQLGFSAVFATVALVMMISSRLAGRLVSKTGSLYTLRIGMMCLLAGAAVLALDEVQIPASISGFILPMWLIALGISLAVSAAPNGAMAGFDHIAGTATAIYFCLGGIILGGVGTFFIVCCPAGSSWPVIAYCVSMAVIVLGVSASAASHNA